MKKFCVLAMALSLCLVFAVSASALEEGSLESQTTFGLYDDDPYDLSINPVFLYQVDRWRLYTNLSNYEDAGAYYMIGTSGKLGPGSFAFFYETNKSELDESDADTDYTANEYINPNLWDLDSNWDWENPRTYTGNNDYTRSTSGTMSFIDETENQNFYIGYSMDFGKFSIGLAYSPEYEDRTVSLRSNGFSYSGGLFQNEHAIGVATGIEDMFGNPTANYTESDDVMEYGNVAHSKYYSDKSSCSFTGSTDIEEKVQPFQLASHIRPSDHFEIEAMISFATIDVNDKGSATYTERWEEKQVGDYDAADGDFGASFDQEFAGYLDKGTSTSTWAGSFLSDDPINNRDGDYWGIEVVPAYEINDIVSVELGLGYEKGDGDTKGRYTQVVTVASTETAEDFDEDGNDIIRTNTYDSTETYNNTFSGDWDETCYALEPKVYLTYGDVVFSLGIGYEYEKYEADYRERTDGTMSYEYDDGHDWNDAFGDNVEDYVTQASYTGYADQSIEVKETAWSFPVATQFKVTDKLTLRAGARFTRCTEKIKHSETEFETENEQRTTTRGNGDVYAGPEYEQTEANRNRDADVDLAQTVYDADTETGTSHWKSEEVTDITEYRLGLGYQVSEHLNFDLMFKETDENNGGVDVQTVYASVTLAF